mgnify:CR=1 FL=1
MEDIHTNEIKMNVQFLEVDMGIIWFILAAYGLTSILVYGKIFDSIRPSKDAWGGRGELFHCPMCMGFWVGMFLFFINGWTELFTFEMSIGNMFICGWIASGSSYILSMLFADNGLRIQNTKEKENNNE